MALLLATIMTKCRFDNPWEQIKTFVEAIQLEHLRVGLNNQAEVGLGFHVVHQIQEFPHLYPAVHPLLSARMVVFAVMTRKNTSRLLLL